MMGKKGFFTHPGFLFILGLLIGAALVYYLFAKGMLPKNLLPF